MPKSNLLFIFTDEQRADTMAAYGNQQIETPNLNRLASQSTVFERAYVTQPVCTPSRSSILTGLYPHTNGCTANNVPLRPETPCFPEMLPRGEYATGYYGKWHLGDEIFRQHGFDEWRSIEDGYRAYYRPHRDQEALSTYYHFLIENGFSPADGKCFTRGQAARLPETFGKPAYLAAQASQFIRKHKDHPFALFVNFLEPHMPFFGPRDGQYDPSDIPLPGNFENPPGPDQPLKTRLLQRAYYDRGHGGQSLRTEQDWRELIARYWGLCSLVDTHVGTILRTLEASGLADNTIVVYTSDHGDMMGSHRLLAKCVMFEEAVRVPLLVRLPGQGRSRRISNPVSQIGLVPTLLDLMHEPVPSPLQGTSMRRCLEGTPREPHDDVFIEWSGTNNGINEREIPRVFTEGVSREEAAKAIGDPVRTVITSDGWKLNYSPRGEHELYNLLSDPLETANLVRQPDTAARIADMTDRITRWQETTRDALPL